MIGALIGDIVGSRFEFNNHRSKEFELFNKDCSITDDSVMSIAVADMCMRGYVPGNKEGIIDLFKTWGRLYPDAGYGGRFYHWLFGENREAYNSYGNGSAMRISAIGWYSKTEAEVKLNVKAVTEVTHNHPEGLKGALVVAMCIFKARNGATKEEIQEYASQYYDLDFDYTDLVKNYRFNETCQESVPQAIYCFLISEDFEDCIRTTISIGGDCDTTAAISGAIAEAYYGVPEEIEKEARKFIPEDMLLVLDAFK